MAPARGREHHRSLGIRHRRSTPKIGTPRLTGIKASVQCQGTIDLESGMALSQLFGISCDRRRGRPKNALCWPRAPKAGSSIIPSPCMPRHRGQQQRRAPFLPRERSTAGDGGAALCARAPRASEKLPKGEFLHQDLGRGKLRQIPRSKARYGNASEGTAHTRTSLTPRVARVASYTGHPTA